MVVDPVSASVAVVHRMELVWAALPDQKWFSYDYAHDILVLGPGDRTMVGQSAGKCNEKGAGTLWRVLFLTLDLRLVGFCSHLCIRYGANVL